MNHPGVRVVQRERWFWGVNRGKNFPSAERMMEKVRVWESEAPVALTFSAWALILLLKRLDWVRSWLWLNLEKNWIRTFNLDTCWCQFVSRFSLSRLYFFHCIQRFILIWYLFRFSFWLYMWGWQEWVFSRSTNLQLLSGFLIVALLFLRWWSWTWQAMEERIRYVHAFKTFVFVWCTIDSFTVDYYYYRNNSLLLILGM